MTAPNQFSHGTNDEECQYDGYFTGGFALPFTAQNGVELNISAGNLVY